VQVFKQLSNVSFHADGVSALAYQWDAAAMWLIGLLPVSLPLAHALEIRSLAVHFVVRMLGKLSGIECKIPTSDARRSHSSWIRDAKPCSEIMRRETSALSRERWCVGSYGCNSTGFRGSRNTDSGARKVAAAAQAAQQWFVELTGRVEANSCPLGDLDYGQSACSSVVGLSLARSLFIRLWHERVLRSEDVHALDRWILDLGPYLRDRLTVRSQ